MVVGWQSTARTLRVSPGFGTLMCPQLHSRVVSSFGRGLLWEGRVGKVEKLSYWSNKEGDL